MLPGNVSGTNKLDKFSPASTFISLVEYNPKERTMDITFHSGSKIRYIDVSPTTFMSFKQSPTHSAYYARAIKGNVQSVKLVDNAIGYNKSTPLKKDREEQALDKGLRHQIARIKRIDGTVNRAFQATVG